VTASPRSKHLDPPDDRPVAEPPAPTWVTLIDPEAEPRADPDHVSPRRVLASLVLSGIFVLVLVGLVGILAASRLAEKQAVNDAAQNAAVVAESVVQPALRDGLALGDPAAFRRMDRAVGRHVIGPASVRVKIWTPTGKIVYSDEARLVGRTFTLDEEERAVFTRPATHAEVSDLSRPENAFERGKGKLLEVYRPVWTPSGSPLLFETYTTYDGVSARSRQLWRGFAGVTLSSLLALSALMLPVVWSLLGKLQAARSQREALLERAVQASADERRRIAGTLHDGVVQELAGASFTVGSAAQRAQALHQDDLARDLKQSGDVVRRSIAGMRSLLVDIYPPNLAREGLIAAVEDLMTGLRSRDVHVTLDIDPASARSLSARQQRLVYRIAHECVLNCQKHAHATTVTLALATVHGQVRLEIGDDGRGFDPVRVVEDPQGGHFGVRVLCDAAREAGATLEVASAPGRGTRWRLTLARSGP
jgi:signal transduction histidine kinase